MMDFAAVLHSHLAAAYPFISIVSHDEQESLGLIEALGLALQRPVLVWAPGTGEPGEASLRARLTLLLSELEAGVGAGAVLGLCDAHPYLAGAETVRLLRLLEPVLSATKTTVIFVSAEPVVPRELERDVTVLVQPLPGRLELEAVARSVFGDGARLERLGAAAVGLTRREAQRAFERARVVEELDAARGRTSDAEEQVVGEKRRLLRGDEALEFCDLRLSLDSVGGLGELKGWLRERREAFGAEAQRFGLPAPRGLLLVGVQGCGKSLAAKAVAGFWGLPLLRLDLGLLIGSAPGAERTLQRTLATAEAMSPCVLWVDELEKGLDEGGATARTLGTLLTWLAERRSAVFFVATANRVEALPPELLRRGRLDEVFFVDLPDRGSRAEILALHLRSRGREPAAFGCEELASQTEHYSGAELEQVVVAGLYRAFAERREMTQRDLQVAAKQLVPLYAMYENEIKALRTWSQGRARPAHTSGRMAGLFGASS